MNSCDHINTTLEKDCKEIRCDFVPELFVKVVLLFGLPFDEFLINC